MQGRGGQTSPSISLAVPISTARAARINEAHRKAVAAGQSMLAWAIEAGKGLIEQKRISPHGGFIPWVEANCTFSYKRAAKYMQAAKSLDPETFDLSVGLDAPPASMRRTARPSPLANPCSPTPSKPGGS